MPRYTVYPTSVAAMKILEPLTLPQLRRIAQERRDDPDVRALLWEIKRLHRTLVQAEDLREFAAERCVEQFGREADGLGNLGRLLEREPAVAEHKAKRGG